MKKDNLIGLGVAGNFAKHLEQAGEASEFKNVEVAEEKQPKALFPYYVASEKAGFLSVYPLTHDRIQIPDQEGNLQMEPELAVLFGIDYQDNKVVAIHPKAFGAYNDCSIRRPNAKKISEKKNWGAHSKGVSANMLPVDSLDKGGVLDAFRIASFLKRDDIVTAYGEDSPVVGYNYFHEKLVDWIIDRMNNQEDFGPMEKISMHLENAGYPTQALISIGATSYTEFGESTYLQEGDVTMICIYNATRYTEQQIAQMAEKGQFESDGLSVLIQEVKA